jgi:hypothetical protein
MIKTFLAVVLLAFVASIGFSQDISKKYWLSLTDNERGSFLLGVLVGMKVLEQVNDYVLEQLQSAGTISTLARSNASEMLHIPVDNLSLENPAYWEASIEAFYMRKGNETRNILEAIAEVIGTHGK